MLGFEEKGAYCYHGIFSVLVAAYATSHLAHLFSHVHVAATSHYVYSQSQPSIYLLSYHYSGNFSYYKSTVRVLWSRLLCAAQTAGV